MTFTSKAQIMQLDMMECPSGDTFEIFPNLMSLPCFDSSYEPGVGWEKTTEFMAADGQYSTTARKVVISYNQQHIFFTPMGNPPSLALWYAPHQNSSFQLTKRASHLTTLKSKQPLDFQKDKTNNIKQEARLLT